MPAIKRKVGARVYIFRAVGWDRVDAHGLTPPDGTRVRLTQPYGCPRNGTMDHVYIEDADTRAFYGLCHRNSLTAPRCRSCGAFLGPRGGCPVNKRDCGR